MRIALAILIAGLTLLAQNPPPPQQPAPVFRGGTTVVPLTVTVVDQKGVPIKDLKQSDFTVSENGRQREIVNFFTQDLAPGPVTPAPVGAVFKPPSGTIEPQTRRTFVIVIGCNPTYKSCEGAERFLREQILPQDAVALVAFNRITALTTDHEALARIIERYKKDADRLYFDLSLSEGTSLFGNSGRPKRDDVIREMDKVLAGGEPLRNVDGMLFGADPAAQVDEPGYRQHQTVAQLLQALNGRNLETLAAGSNRFKLFAAIEFLRYIEGEKHVVFINSGGGLSRDADDAKIVARRATDAHVIIDMVGPGFSWASRDVVEQTGGYYSTLEVTSKGLTKLENSTRFSYLLGYAPFNPELDGKYRTVDVKVNRKNVTVKFQHGYYATAKPDPVDFADILIKARLEAVLAYDQQATDIPITATATLLPRLGIQSEVRVDVVIDVSQLTFEMHDGVRTGQLELQAFLGDPGEIVIGDFAEHLEIRAGEETYQQWLQTGIHRSVRVRSFGTPKFVKVVVYDYGSDKAGSAMVILK